MRRTTTIITASVLMGTGSVLANDPFRTATLAPPDVRLFVHVDGATGLYGPLRDRPIAGWVRAWMARGELPGAWQRLSDAAGLTGRDLFETCLGRQFTLMSRSSAEWVLLTEIEPRRSAALLGRLAPVVRAPRDNVGVFHLAKQGLLLARAHRLVLIAPDDQPGLFDAVLGNLAGVGPRSLALHEGIAQDRELGSARVGVFMRHEPPLGGWSVAVADLDDDRVRVRHRSQFEDAPFRSRATALSWSPAPLRCLEGTGLFSYIEPTDTAGGPLDAFAATLLGEPLIASALGANLGPRRITAVSDLEGRLEDPPFDLLLPTVVRACEVNDAELAWSQLDAHMIRLVAALNRLGQGSFTVEVPDPDGFEPGGTRTVSLGPMARWLLGDVPGIDGVMLSWTVVRSAATQWCVVASHPEHLETVADALRASRDPPEQPQRWTNCGVGDGKRLAQHLGSWFRHAGVLAAPEDVAAMRETLVLLRELAQGVEQCRWRLARPSVNGVSTEAEIILSPPDSAADFAR